MKIPWWAWRSDPQIAVMSGPNIVVNCGTCRGGKFIVGERGPEIIIPRVAGVVKPPR